MLPYRSSSSQPALRAAWEESMEKFYVLLMIAVIVYALFANKINMAVRGDEKVKKVIVVFSVGVLLVCVIAIGASILS